MKKPKPIRRMLGGLVYSRLVEAVDVDKLLELEASLMILACQAGAEDPDNHADLVADVVHRQWRRLGKQLIGRLGQCDILPRPD
jgi:hypothetical protein